MFKIVFSFLLVNATFSSFSQQESNYSFYLYESMPFGVSMKKNASNYTTIERLVYRITDTEKLKKKGKKILGFSFNLAQLLMAPLTHEEGHRSILTSNGYGSISMQFYNKQGIAIVSGIYDSTLLRFKNEKLTDYIRLHTAGMESDYLIKQMTDEIMAFEEDKLRNVIFTNFIRSSLINGYHFTSFLPKLFKPIKESENELKNDIVGHDIFGAVKNLYRPELPFYRYTNYSDLTSVEKGYLRTAAVSSFLNYISPAMIKFKIKDTKISVGSGYTMAPFGGIYQLNVWAKNKYKFAFTLDLFSNKNKVGPGISLKIKEIECFGLKGPHRIYMSARGILFQQPKDLSFQADEHFIGGLVSTEIRYKTSAFSSIPISLFLGLTAKSKGFVVGETFLDAREYFDFGASFYLK